MRLFQGAAALHPGGALSASIWGPGMRHVIRAFTEFRLWRHAQMLCLYRRHVEAVKRSR
jgi:hypothetical protein